MQTASQTVNARDTHVYKVVDGREVEADVIGARISVPASHASFGSTAAVSFSARAKRRRARRSCARCWIATS